MSGVGGGSDSGTPPGKGLLLWERTQPSDVLFPSAGNALPPARAEAVEDMAVIQIHLPHH